MLKTQNKAALRDEVRQLAEEAFNEQLITGHGDGQYTDSYQIHIEGKPRQFTLQYARSFLKVLLDRLSDPEIAATTFQHYSQLN